MCIAEMPTITWRAMNFIAQMRFSCSVLIFIACTEGDCAPFLLSHSLQIWLLIAIVWWARKNNAHVAGGGCCGDRQNAVQRIGINILIRLFASRSHNSGTANHVCAWLQVDCSTCKRCILTIHVCRADAWTPGKRTHPRIDNRNICVSIDVAKKGNGLQLLVHLFKY